MSEALYAQRKQKPVVVILQENDGSLAVGSLPSLTAYTTRVSVETLATVEGREIAFSKALQKCLSLLNGKPYFAGAPVKLVD